MILKLLQHVCDFLAALLEAVPEEVEVEIVNYMYIKFYFDDYAFNLTEPDRNGDFADTEKIFEKAILQTNQVQHNSQVLVPLVSIIDLPLAFLSI